MSASASRRSTCPTKSGPTRRPSIGTAPGATSRRTDTCWYPTVAVGLASVLPRPLGRRCGRTAGRGSAPIPGRGRRITTGAGDSPPASWFWIPGRSWAPAWVSWAYAPGYVSWCPLGWNNRPVLQIVNINRYGRGYDPWRAWTVVPRRHFGADYVNVQDVVPGRPFDARTRGSFVAAVHGAGHPWVRRAALVRADSRRRHRVHRGGRARRSTRTSSRARRASVAAGSASIVGRTPQLSRESTPAPDRVRASRGRAPIAAPARDGGRAGRRRNPPPALLHPQSQREAAGATGPCPRAELPSTVCAIPSQRHLPIEPASAGFPLGRAPASLHPIYRESPYGRRAPERSEPGAAPRPEYRPYGNAVPRAPEGPRPAAPETRPYGGAPREELRKSRQARTSRRPARLVGGERRAPA